MTSRFIGSGLYDRSSDQVRGKVVCCKPLTTPLLDKWLLNYRDPLLVPYRLPPTANRWPHCGGGITPVQRCIQRILQLQPTGRVNEDKYKMLFGSIIQIAPSWRYVFWWWTTIVIPVFLLKRKDSLLLYSGRKYSSCRKEKQFLILVKKSLRKFSEQNLQYEAFFLQFKEKSREFSNII